jgi:hypothetical protein|nr:MAG TPA: hypothetical protein [Caudoviricetes sp.]
MENESTPVFPAEAILTSQKYRKYVDLLRMKLEPGKEYSYADVDGIIEAFLKAPVKEAVVGRKE